MKTIFANKFNRLLMMGLTMFMGYSVIPMAAHAENYHGGWDKDRHGEFHEKHMAKLHDALKLSASQEGGWKNFTQEIKPEERGPAFDREAMAKLSTPERLDRMLEKSRERQQKMESHVQAIKTFYTTLNPEQRKVFDEQFHSHRGMLRGWEHHGKGHHHERCDHHEKHEAMEKK